MTDLIEDADRDLWELHLRFIARSGNQAGSIEDERFLALALAGEAGEVANFIKKQWRGDAVDREALKDELSDVFAYWCLLVRCAGFDVAGVIARSHSKAREKIEQLENIDPLMLAGKALYAHLFGKNRSLGNVGIGPDRLHVYVKKKKWHGDTPSEWQGYPVEWYFGVGRAVAA